MAHPRRVDFIELKFGERLAEIDADNLGTDGRGERFDAYGLVVGAVAIVGAVVRHGVVPPVYLCSPVCLSDKLLSE